MVNGLANNAEMDDSGNCDATVVLLKRGNPGAVPHCGAVTGAPGPTGCACPGEPRPPAPTGCIQEQADPGDGQPLEAGGSSWTKRAGGGNRETRW